MPSYTRGRLRDQVRYVKANATLWYGFKTKDLSQVTGVTEADITALGHTTAAAVGANAILVFNANSPKPSRMTKRIATSGTGQGSVSSFVGYDKISGAIAAGWTLSKRGRIPGLRSTGKTITAVVDLGTGQAMYAFSLNDADFQSYGADLGLKSASSITTDTEVRKLVFGSSTPKPGRAIRRLQNGSTFSCFYAPDKMDELATDGWRVVSEAVLLTPPTQAAPAGGT